jgi:hypothetical protein
MTTRLQQSHGRPGKLELAAHVMRPVTRGHTRTRVQHSRAPAASSMHRGACCWHGKRLLHACQGQWSPPTTLTRADVCGPRCIRPRPRCALLRAQSACWSLLFTSCEQREMYRSGVLVQQATQEATSTKLGSPPLATLRTGNQHALARGVGRMQQAADAACKARGALAPAGGGIQEVGQLCRPADLLLVRARDAPGALHHPANSRHFRRGLHCYHAPQRFAPDLKGKTGVGDPQHNSRVCGACMPGCPAAAQLLTGS